MLLLLLCQYVITIIIPLLLLLLSHYYYYYPSYVITIIIPVCYHFIQLYQPYFIMIFAPGAVLLAPGLQWHPQRSPAAVPGEVSLRARRETEQVIEGVNDGKSVAKPSKYPGKIMENYRKSWNMMENDRNSWWKMIEINDGKWSKLMMEHVSDVFIFHIPRIWLWTF